MIGNTSQHAFGYLYEDHPRRIELTRRDPKTVVLEVPRVIDFGPYVVPYDERDQRVLIVFDGEIPWCGIPRAAGEQLAVVVGELTVDVSHARKPREGELASPYHIPSGVAKTPVPLVRHFVLLPAGRALIMRYRPKSLAGWYSMVEVKKLGPDSVSVDFLNSDY